MMKVGDFYEFWGEDAVMVAAEIDRQLERRTTSGEKILTCAVPYHEKDSVIDTLCSEGYTVVVLP
jgi:DNA mismatch repair protein MutS